MVLHEAQQILIRVLLLRPRSLDNSKKGLFHFLILGAELDAFQRAVIVFTPSSALRKVANDS